MMRAFAGPGARVPMISTGVGKALLAAGSRPLPVQATGTGSAGLATELAAIAARGWALDDEEQSVGLRCVAAAISPPRGLQPIAALSISGPTARISNDRLDVLGRMVVDAAADIGRAL